MKVKIGGTNYAFRPESLRVVDKIGSRSTAEFSLRQNKATMATFQRGQEVIIWDDAHTESVDVSNQFTPYGAPGLLWNTLHDGEVHNGMLPVVNNCDAGTYETLIALQSGVEDFIASASTNICWYLSSTDNGGGYTGTIATGWFEVVSGSIRFHVRVYTWYGAGQNHQIDLITGAAAPTFNEGQVYRISLTWAHSGGSPGTESFILYVDGTSRATGSNTGWLFHDGSMVNFGTHLGVTIYTSIGTVETYQADMRFYSTAQTQSTIDTNKFSRLTGSETDLICYWKIDEMTGTNCDDLTSYSHDGTLQVGGGSYLPEWGVALKDWTGLYTGSGTHGAATKDYRWFTGRIESITLEKLPPNYYEIKFQCTDASSRFDERTMNANVSSMKAGDILKAYIPRYFGADLIGVRTVSDGPTILSLRLQFDKARTMLDDIKKYSGYIWYVDAYKELRYHAATAIAAPFNIDNTDTAHSYYPLEINYEGLNSNYANRIIARAQINDTTVIFICQDTTEIAARIAIEGGTGIYEQYTDLATVTSIDHGEMLTKGLLSDAIDIGVNLSYTTRYTWGLRVGQKQHVKHTELGLDDDFIIIGLTYRLEAGVEPQYDVKLSSSRAYQEFGNQMKDMVESKSNFRTSGATQYDNVSYP